MVDAHGKMWMKCAQGMVFNANDNNCTGSPTSLQFCSTADNSCNGGNDESPLDSGPAFESCEALVFAGFSDWRVPTKEELASLVVCNDGLLNHPERSDCGGVNITSPAIDTSLFTNFPSASYWTQDSSSASNAWYVSFGTGTLTNGLSKTSNFRVLCIR